MCSDVAPVSTIGGSIGDNKEPEAEDEESDGAELKRLSKGWRSAAYGFFKPDVKVGYDGKHKYHLFSCAAKKCKGLKGVHGVQHFQDSKDHAATSNLKSHAIKCFGQEAVDAAFNGTHPKARDTSIFAAFARQGQQPIKISHHAHTKAESHAHISRWCAKNNHPLHIVKDQHFEVLIKAGRPTTYIPSPSMVSRDIKAVFEKSREHIDRILKVSQLSMHRFLSH
ncbi:hypothetical protein L208DRAFT_1326376 [Tricholoma matsutake]|nr:hypothetical protein L208DRAFT_1326376 [Tricholoma matsutake 945]